MKKKDYIKTLLGPKSELKALLRVVLFSLWSLAMIITGVLIEQSVSKQNCQKPLLNLEKNYD